jgi:acyl dehydratase
MTETLFNNVEFLNTESAIKGGRPVPGALVYSFAEGLLMQATMQGTGLAFLEAKLEIKGPTFVGDTIHAECEVTELRPTSKGNRAIVRTRNEIKNQHGEVVIVYDPLRMMKGR